MPKFVDKKLDQDTTRLIEENETQNELPTSGIKSEFGPGTDLTLNGGFTAQPHQMDLQNPGTAESDMVTTEFDYGSMNEADAKASGYTDQDGHAVSKAKHDVTGSPTGAYTDVGMGRSSAVVSKHKLERETGSEVGQDKK